jgi:hypothetical protein
MPARAGRFSDYQINIWLSALAGATKYYALFSSDPYLAGTPTAVEMTGTGYARAIGTESLSGKIVTVTTALSWPTIPSGSTLSHIGAFDAAFNGNLLFAGPIPGGPRSYPAGGSLVLNANSYHYGIDA